jgi:hypothetical protein
MFLTKLVSTVLAVSLSIAIGSPEAEAATDQREAEISFAVQTLREENVEGPDVERTFFWAGSKRIVFGQPKGTRLSPDGGNLLILLTDLGLDGEIHVSPSPFRPDFDLAENALTYRETSAQRLPNGAMGVQVQQPVLNPYPYNGWKSLGFRWEYSFSGRRVVRTVSYINLEIGSQIVVTTLASRDDAEKVVKVAKDFMSSWWVMSR